MEIHVHIHQHDSAVEKKLDLIIKHQEHIMSAVDDLKALLGEINASTTEIAADVAALLAKVSTGMSEAEVAEVKSGMQAVSDQLKTVAAAYTPPA